MFDSAGANKTAVDYKQLVQLPLAFPCCGCWLWASCGRAVAVACRDPAEIRAKLNFATLESMHRFAGTRGGARKGIRKWIDQNFSESGFGQGMSLPRVARGV